MLKPADAPLTGGGGGIDGIPPGGAGLGPFAAIGGGGGADPGIGGGGALGGFPIGAPGGSPCGGGGGGGSAPCGGGTLCSESYTLLCFGDVSQIIIWCARSTRTLSTVFLLETLI